MDVEAEDGGGVVVRSGGGGAGGCHLIGPWEGARAWESG